VAAAAAAAAPTPSEPVATPASTTSGAATGAPKTTAASRGSDDALNLGTTVLPILVKSYWKQAVAGVVVIGVIVWIITR
jgi:hypothetical protein